VQPLDNPVWHALTGPQATVAEGTGLARRYRPEYSVFSALPDDPDAAAWNDLAALVGSDGYALLTHDVVRPASWDLHTSFPVHQMILEHDVSVDTARVVRLGAADVDDLTSLIRIAQPGPWADRTHELGDFFGIRDGNQLVAAAGQRMQLAEAVEISAVAALPEARGRGYGAAVTRAAADAILSAGAQPFLHVRADNLDAIRMYERVGFVIRRTTPVGLYHPSGN
jgi:predicted GNAT family acetyltransferase